VERGDINAVLEMKKNALEARTRYYILAQMDGRTLRGKLMRTQEVKQ
jgi:hypothetical protein